MIAKLIADIRVLIVQFLKDVKSEIVGILNSARFDIQNTYIVYLNQRDTKQVVSIRLNKIKRILVRLLKLSKLIFLTSLNFCSESLVQVKRFARWLTLFPVDRGEIEDFTLLLLEEEYHSVITFLNNPKITPLMKTKFIFILIYITIPFAFFVFEYLYHFHYLKDMVLLLESKQLRGFDDVVYKK